MRRSVEEIIRLNGFKLKRSQAEILEFYSKNRQGLLSHTFAVFYDFIDDPLYPDHKPITSTYETVRRLREQLDRCTRLCTLGMEDGLPEQLDRLCAYLWLLGREEVLVHTRPLPSAAEFLVGIHDSLHIEVDIELYRQMDEIETD